MMKLQFEPNLDYQHAAIEAVCGLFRGQEVCHTEFTVVTGAACRQMLMGFAGQEGGVGNRLTLLEEEYQRWARHPDYQSLFDDVDLSRSAQEVHDGYFSIDRKGGWTVTVERNQEGRVYKSGYPPTWNAEVFEKVMEQAENFKSHA